MSNLALEQNVSYQQTIHKQRVKKVKSLIHEYKTLRRKEDSVTNMIADTVIKMESYSTLKKIHVQLGGEKVVSYKSLWRWVDNRKKALALSKVVGRTKANAEKSTMIKAIERIRKGATDKEMRDIFKSEKKRIQTESRMSPEDRSIINMIEQTRVMSFSINHSFVLKGLDQEQLSNLHENIKQVQDGLDKHFGTKSVKKKKVQRKKVSKRSSAKVDLKVVS